MIKSDVEAPPPEWIPDPPFLIGSEHDERNGPGAHGPELWNAQLPVAKYLKKQRLKLVIDLVDFIHEQYAGLLVQQCPKQGAFREELEAMQFLTDGIPITAELGNSCFQKKPLQSLIKFSDRLVLINPDVALQALHVCFCGSGNSVCEFGFAAARRSFNQEWPPHVGSEIDDRQDVLVGHVSARQQLLGKVY